MPNLRHTMMGAAGSAGGGAGSIWTWGSANGGKMGTETSVNVSSPLQVGALEVWTKVTRTGGNTFATKNTGELWGWGQNQNGQLGDVTVVGRSSPVQVGSLTDWEGAQFVGGGSTNFARKTDGTIWSWGRGYSGYSGHGDTENRSSPTQIGALTTWSKIAGCSNHTMALKSDGTLWTWGRNAQGQLGRAVVVNQHFSSPVQIGALTTWTDCSAGNATSQAIKGGTLWTWGQTPYGQDGRDGDHANDKISSPVQVGSLTNWARTYASAGTKGGTIHAIKTDGTLWGWGNNYGGPIGDSTGLHKSSPVQIGSLTDWTYVQGGTDWTVAYKEIDTDLNTGTIWAWGHDSDYGTNAQGDRTSRTSPTQIGTQTGWQSIGAQGGTGAASGLDISAAND